MKLQDQCCTREQGQRLIELGVKPNAAFWWMPKKNHIHGECIRYGYHGYAIAPAFNVAELGEMLPSIPAISPKRDYAWYHRNNWRGHSVGYSHVGGEEHIESDWYETEAQARAALLIHLLENKLICLQEK